VLGEHGDGAVPIFSRVGPAVSTEQRAVATTFVRDWYRRHVALDAGRSSARTSSAGIARMIGAMSSGDGEQWVASVLLEASTGWTASPPAYR
jgi:malate dehydrogenase